MLGTGVLLTSLVAWLAQDTKSGGATFVWSFIFFVVRTRPPSRTGERQLGTGEKHMGSIDHAADGKSGQETRLRRTHQKVTAWSVASRRSRGTSVAEIFSASLVG